MKCPCPSPMRPERTKHPRAAAPQLTPILRMMPLLSRTPYTLTSPATASLRNPSHVGARAAQMAFRHPRAPALTMPTASPRALVPTAFSAKSQGASRLTPQQSRTSSSRRNVGTTQDASLVKDAAKLGLLVIMKAIAATKLYQANTVRAVATSTLLVHACTQSYSAPDTRQHSSSPHPQQPITPQEASGLPSPSPSPDPTTAPSPPPSTPFTDMLLEAAIWVDELRHMQARRAQLHSDLQHLTQRLATPTPQPAAAAATPATTTARSATPAATTPARPAAAPAAAAAAFVSTGPEFCALTCAIEASPDVEQLRHHLRSQVHALSTHLVSSTARGSASPSPPHLAFLDQVLSGEPVDLAAVAVVVSHPLVADGAQVKELQRLWDATAQDVTHLLVRLCVHQQLPAQPKQRVTVAYVREQVVNHLYERIACLAGSSSCPPDLQP